MDVLKFLRTKFSNAIGKFFVIKNIQN